MKRTTTNRLALVVLASTLGLVDVHANADAPAVSATPPPPPPLALSEHAARAQELTLGLDLDDARKELALADADDASAALERGRLALYEADCDGASLVLARPELAKTEQGAALADIARGCARVTAATIVARFPEKDVEVRFQDEADAALGPLLAETVAKARDALTRDLGVTWPKPTRVTVVRDLLSLSLMTGLPYESATTTGTVAVAKWGRVTLLSPRASHHGYAWRDTIAHELTHLAVTRATVDRAPLWLQEGVAKREEVRWREPGPFDDRPSPDAVVARGIELKIDLGLDKLGPSIAMLPSADAAMVAFAEVTSFVRFYATTSGPEALPRLLAALRDKKSPDEALKQVSGSDLKAWDTKWRSFLASKPKELLPPMLGLGGDPPNVRELRERVRLGELLFGRHHAPEALVELDKVSGALDDPSYRYVRGRALEAMDRADDARLMVQDPKEVLASYGPWWALRGILARAKNDDHEADPAFVEAVATDPLDVEAACEAHVPADPQGGRKPADSGLCAAARARNEPGLGED